MSSFKRGRTETWVLITVNLIILSAIGKVSWDNSYNAQPFTSPAGQTMNKQMGALPTDSTQRRAGGTYAPPTQPSKSYKGGGNASQGVKLSADYVRAPDRSQYTSQSKLQERQYIDLNSADTLALQQVSGIGPNFARCTVRYRDQLGGYCTVLQLQKVFGMEPNRY